MSSDDHKDLRQLSHGDPGMVEPIDIDADIGGDHDHDPRPMTVGNVVPAPGPGPGYQGTDGFQPATPEEILHMSDDEFEDHKTACSSPEERLAAAQAEIAERDAAKPVAGKPLADLKEEMLADPAVRAEYDRIGLLPLLSVLESHKVLMGDNLDISIAVTTEVVLRERENGSFAPEFEVIQIFEHGTEPELRRRARDFMEGYVAGATRVRS